jgi:hypothetical protein
MLGPATSDRMTMLDDDDDETELRGPRMMGSDQLEDFEEESFPRAPTLTRRQSEDIYSRQSSLSRTPTRPLPGLSPRGESFDMAGNPTRERKTTTRHRESLDKTGNMVWNDDLELMRTNKIGRREWEWDWDRERERDNMGIGRMGMGMPPAIMVTERWV